MKTSTLILPPKKIHQMKKAIFSIAILTAFLFSASLPAQTFNTWKGGAPGHETDWHFHKNWSLGKAPDEFSRVIIPDVSTTTQRYPVISGGEVEVWSLEIQPKARLVFSGGTRLLVTTWENRGECSGCKVWVLPEYGVQGMASIKH
jgi:hypothetical protein